MSSAKKPHNAKEERPTGSGGIREVEEAKSLLRDQLHSLYWWVFNAYKMRGYIRAKGLDELQRRGATQAPNVDENTDPAAHSQ